MLCCKDCRYWDAYSDSSGLCRKTLPTRDATIDAGIRGFWPETDDDDWCGEARPRVVMTRFVSTHNSEEVAHTGPTGLDAEAES